MIMKTTDKILTSIAGAKAGKGVRILLFLALLITGREGLAQTDTEFWFAAPKITQGHGTGGVPIYIRLASMNIPAQVTISIPANPAFVPIVVNLGANDAQTVDLSLFRDLMENDPYLGTLPLDRGIRVQSDNMITAYYEVGTHLNPDIFALKGRNALGTEFFVPFQNYFRNGNYSPQPYSSILIVATEDNTEVTITPTKPAHPGRPAGVPFTVVLNRGQTYAVGPDNMIAGVHPRAGQLPENRLAGTRIVSNKPVAVTTADDSVDAHPHANCKDLIGDQIVPVSIIGTEYIAMQGRLNAGMRESFYVTATQNTTQVEIDGIYVITLNIGEVYRHEFTMDRHHIKTSEPAYVYHVAGFGCEMGGGILPPVNVCTGSTQVSFTRSKGESFFMNILVRAGAEDGFILNGDAALIQDVDFNAVPGTTDWLAAEFEFDQAVIPVGVASMIQNTKDVFHLGIINGGPTSGTMYGYFSDFNELEVRANVEGTNSNVLRTCYGVPVQLFASGGTSYNWEPHSYLDDPLSPTPIANPLSSTLYKVTVSGACNMTDSATISVQVSTPVEAKFTFDEAAVCAPEEVTLYNQSTGGTNFRWYVDNVIVDMTSTPDDITYLFENNTDAPVEHTIELVVRNVDGYSDQLQRKITVYPSIVSDFSVDLDAGCDPVEVKFTNLSSGNTDQWYWDFGDGASSPDEHPSHLFLNRTGTGSITYPVTLTAVSPFGCRDTSEMNITVDPYIEAGFTFDQPSGCAPLELVIKDQSIGATSYLWDFGDGNTSTTSSGEFVHIFENSGTASVTRTIRLTVTNDKGCQDIIEREVTIHPEVNAGFTADPIDGCSPHNVTFTNLSAGATSYVWYFGDGSGSDEAAPQHTYPVNYSGHDVIYDVMLIAISDQGCSDTARVEVAVHPLIEASFSIDNIEGCHPLSVTINSSSTGADHYLWDFGDGSGTSTTSQAAFTHTFHNTGSSDRIFELKLVVENDQGCRDSLTREILVYPQLTANFQPGVSGGCEPLIIDFMELSKNAAKWEWDFGDGAGSDEPNPTHTFINTGTSDLIRQVQLTTTSANGHCTTTNSWDIRVHGRVEANFTTGSNTGCNPFDVELINQSYGGSDYFWDFGDDESLSTSSEDPVNHIFSNSSFSAAEDYNVTLIAENYAGCTSELTKQVTVLPDIIAEFTPSQTGGCHPLTISFANDTEGGQLYRWDFGDGSSSSEYEPAHTFTNTGTTDSIYRVMLVSTAPNNVCQDSFYVDITVHPYVKADFNLDGNTGCNPFDVEIENTSVNASVYYWDFNDGSDSITYSTGSFVRRFSNPSFDTSATYTINMRAENYAGCISETSRTLEVKPSISAEFEPNTREGCHPLEVEFSNTSKGVKYYSWDFGNGNYSSEAEPVHTFSNTGTADSVYRVRLVTIADNNTCTDTFYVDIRVHPYVNAGFNFPESSGCTPFEIEFSNSSIGAEKYIWDFGDGKDTITWNNDSFTHIFTNPGYDDQASYPVNLTAINYAGCEDRIEKNINVHNDIDALFTATVTDGCHPLEVDFENLTKGGSRHEWDFGDGVTSTDHSPRYTFMNTESVTITRVVTLRSFSEDQCISEYSMDITVYPNPRASFETDNTTTCPPFDFPVSNTSIDADHYTWIFGDGEDYHTTSKDLFYHRYDNQEEATKTYTLQLIAETQYGCSDSTSQPVRVYPRVNADFSSATEGCSPLAVNFQNNTTGAVSYHWDFGDGLGIGIKDPHHVYFNNSFNDTSYFVRLAGISEYGCTDTAGYEIAIYPQPEAEFTVNPVFQEYPSLSVDIDNVSKDGIWEYKWDFDDGNFSDKRYPGSYEFGDWGEYNIGLRVWNDNCSDSVSHRIYIKPPVPVAAFDTLVPGCVPHTVRFINNSIYGHSYYWDFDDGNTSEDPEPVHTFQEHGVYNVKLIVYGEGGEDFTYREIEVYRKPVVDFKVAPDTVLLPDEEIRLYNMSEYGETYEWNFGDGNYSAEKNPEHLYTELGVYDISLAVWTEHNCTERMFIERAVTVTGSGEIFFPSAFRPNPSGPSGGWYDPADPTSNNIFRPFWDGVTKYRLRIYNRWGEFLFESTDIMQGWDGYYQERLAKQDVYVWKAWVTFTNGSSKVMAGDVTLIR